MIVSDIIDDAKKIFGICDEQTLFSHISEAVEVLANHGDFDPLLAYADLCVSDRVVTLPREIETPLAVNIGGKPAVGRDQFFTFHYNGPGDGWTECNLSWQDLGNFPTYEDIKCPSRVIAFVDREEDAGKEVWVYGVDTAGNEVRTKIGGEWKNGYLVPTVFGYAVPASDAPTFSRIRAIRKEVSAGPIRVSSFDNSTFTGTLLAVMQWDDEESVYRRIKLSRNCGDWIRMAFRRRVFKIRSLDDVLPINLKTALLMMMRAIRYYDEADLANAEAYESTAARMLTQKQLISSPPNQSPIQVNDNLMIQDKSDDVD